MSQDYQYTQIQMKKDVVEKEYLKEITNMLNQGELTSREIDDLYDKYQTRLAALDAELTFVAQRLNTLPFDFKLLDGEIEMRLGFNIDYLAEKLRIETLLDQLNDARLAPGASRPFVSETMNRMMKLRKELDDLEKKIDGNLQEIKGLQRQKATHREFQKLERQVLIGEMYPLSKEPDFLPQPPSWSDVAYDPDVLRDVIGRNSEFPIILEEEDEEVEQILNIPEEPELERQNAMVEIDNEIQQITHDLVNQQNIQQPNQLLVDQKESWRRWLYLLRTKMHLNRSVQSFVEELFNEIDFQRIIFRIWEFFVVLYDPSIFDERNRLFGVVYTNWLALLKMNVSNPNHFLYQVGKIHLLDNFTGFQVQWILMNVVFELVDRDQDVTRQIIEETILNFEAENTLQQKIWTFLIESLVWITKLYSENIKFQSLMLISNNYRKIRNQVIGKDFINFYPLMIGSLSGDLSVLMGDLVQKFRWAYENEEKITSIEVHFRTRNRFINQIAPGFEQEEVRWMVYKWQRLNIGRQEGQRDLSDIPMINQEEFTNWVLEWLIEQFINSNELYNGWMLTEEGGIDLDFVQVDKITFYARQNGILEDPQFEENPFVWTKIRCRKLFAELGLISEVTECGICLFEAWWTYQNIHKIQARVKENGFNYWKKSDRKKMIFSEFLLLTNEEKEIILSGDVRRWVVFKRINSEFIINWNIDQPSSLDFPYYIILLDNHAFVTSREKLLAHRSRCRSPIDYQNKLIWEMTKPKPKSYQGENWFLDIETCTNSNNKFIPYLICLRGEYNGPFCQRWDDETNHLNQRTQIWWGFDCIEKFRTWLSHRVDTDNQFQLSKKKKDYRRITIWTYNGNKFDLIFLIRSMVNIKGFDLKGGLTNIKALNVGNVEFKDLLNICPFGSLKSQSEFWNTETRKGEVDHNAITEFWIQKENEIDYDIETDSVISCWTNEDKRLKEEIIEYCVKDVQVLKECVIKMVAWLSQNLQMDQEFISTAGMALRYFSMHYFPKHELHIPQGIPRNLYDCVKKSYKGGIVMVLKKKNTPGTKLCKLDVNSMYPAAMLDFMPIKLQGKYDYQQPKNLLTERLHPTWLYCIQKLKWKEGTRIPTIPSRDENGGLNHVINHETIEWIWGVELSFAIQTGNVESGEILSCMSFQVAPIFKEYITKLYSLRQPAKANGDKIADRFYKLLMNSLYGKFGQKLYPEKVICSTENLGYHLDDCFGVPEEIIDGIWSLEKGTFDDKYHKQVGSAIHIASYITAKARTILMNGAQIASKNWTQDNLVYFDTDCIIMEYKDDIDFPQSEIHATELGKWDIEGKDIIEGMFPAKKLYYLRYADGKEEMKSKGVKSSAMTKEIYQKLIAKEEFQINGGIKFVRGKGFVSKAIDSKKLVIKDNRIYNDSLTSSMPKQYL